MLQMNRSEGFAEEPIVINELAHEPAVSETTEDICPTATILMNRSHISG